MKKIFLLLVAAIAFVGVDTASAQSRSSYFMEGSYFRNDLNPALAPTRGYVALPGLSGVGLNLSNNFLSIDNFIYQRDNKLVTALHSSVSADEFLGKLPSLGKINMDTKLNILGVGFYAKRMYWTFGINANLSTDMAMSMDMFKALKTLGNGVYDLGNTALQADAYLDAYIGTSFFVHDNVRVGAKLKFLVGFASLDAQFSQLSANVTPDVVNAAMKGTWRANGIFIDSSNMSGVEDVGNAMSVDAAYMMSSFKNFGLAVDLGAEVRLLDDQLKVSAAVTDLGFIKWKGGSNQISGSIDGGFAFNGMNFETSEMDAEYDFVVKMDDVNDKGYASMVNCSLNVGAEYNILNDHIAFGLLSHTKFCNAMTYSELIASVNFRPTNWITATFSHTFLNKNRPGIFGFALNVHPAGINFFAGLDFIGTKWVNSPTINGVQFPLPRYMKSMNAYVGIGFNFARPRYFRD